MTEMSNFNAFSVLPPCTAIVWDEFQKCPQRMYNLFETPASLMPGNVKHMAKSDNVLDLSAAEGAPNLW